MNLAPLSGDSDLDPYLTGRVLDVPAYTGRALDVPAYRRFISTFPNALENAPDGSIDLRYFISSIQGGVYKTAIDDYRVGRINKPSLRAVTLGGQFLIRNRTGLLDASFLIQVDFDEKDNPGLYKNEKLKNEIFNEEFVVATFIGPSGTGYKAIVEISDKITIPYEDAYAKAAQQLHDYFYVQYGLKSDKAIKDTCRLCFVSYDEKARCKTHKSGLPGFGEVPSEPIKPFIVDCTGASARSTSSKEDDKAPAPVLEDDDRKQRLVHIATLLNHIPTRPDYDEWIRIISAVYSYIDKRDINQAIELLCSWSPEENEDEYRRKYNPRLKEIGIGSLMKTARFHGCPDEHLNEISDYLHMCRLPRVACRLPRAAGGSAAGAAGSAAGVAGGFGLGDVGGRAPLEHLPTGIWSTEPAPVLPTPAPAPIGNRQEQILRKKMGRIKPGVDLQFPSQIKFNPKVNFIIKHVIAQGAMSVVYGASNVGKTFFAMDIAAAVASDLSKWRDGVDGIDGRTDGLKIKHGPVLYFTLEGSHGARNRILALKSAGLLTDDDPLAICSTPLNLLDEGGEQDIIAAIEVFKSSYTGGKSCEDPVLIVIDTLNRAFGGGNENASEDMGMVIKACDKIRKLTNAHIMVIHHSGKDEAKGARGHTSLRGATDTEIELICPNESEEGDGDVESPEDGHGEPTEDGGKAPAAVVAAPANPSLPEPASTADLAPPMHSSAIDIGEFYAHKLSPIIIAEIKKQRDISFHQAMPFRLKQVYLGKDDDGDAVTSCVLLHVQHEKKIISTSSIEDKEMQNERRLAALKKHRLEQKAKQYKSLQAHLPASSIDEWRDKVMVSEGISKATFHRLKSEMQERNLFKIIDNIFIENVPEV